jgi:mono/diheme cytochrome c family protein
VKTTLWLALTILSAAVALGQSGARGGGGQRGSQQQSGTATGNTAGATILQRACSSCHGADVIANHHFESADAYRDLVNTMIDAGAPVTPQELPVLVDYLFATYGKKPAAGSPQTAATDPGKAILDSACTTCHGLEGLANHAYETRGPYESLIGNMVAYGATVTPAQVPVLADYLLKTYGKKPAATNTTASTADPGKAILEGACTTCHGLDGLANHNYTSKAPYESLVRSMVAYGAVVTDAQIPPLVDYMFKTYGKK